MREAGLPSFVFINKMDRDRADFDMAFNGLSSVLGMKPVTLYMPVMTDGVFAGVVDILGGKALMFGENGAVTEALIPDAIADEAALLHDTTVENIAESDEELMEKYLEEGSLSEEDLASGLRKGVLNASLVPVVVGSSLENKGGRWRRGRPGLRLRLQDHCGPVLRPAQHGARDLRHHQLRIDAQEHAYRGIRTPRHPPLS